MSESMFQILLELSESSNKNFNDRYQVNSITLSDAEIALSLSSQDESEEILENTVNAEKLVSTG